MQICLTCGVCCLQTEMQLSQDDIERIERESNHQWSRDQFCSLVDEYYQLKNVDNHCIFFNPETKLCNIYVFRPKGCEFYPLTYNPDIDRCELDLDCPHRSVFYRHRPEFESKCRQLRQWVKVNLMKQK